MGSYDIETYLEKDIFKPYCVCYKYKKYEEFFYFKEEEDIVLNSILSLFDRMKSKTIILYVHNLTFDGMLIIASLTKQKNLKFSSFMKKTSIYSINIKNNKGMEIIFKCSYKILPVSLKKASVSFNLGNKMIFPYDFSSFKHLFYCGPVPDSKYFNTYEEWFLFYNTYKNFDFKEYSIKYCLNDVMLTYNLILKIENILKEMQIPIKSVVSAPSLSLKIFEKKFNHKKVRVAYKHFQDRFVRTAYYGGRCEVFGNPIKDDYIFHFDFPGMYALCMKEKFPYGNYKIITYPKTWEEPGFYFIEGFSPIEQHIPILPQHRFRDSKLIFCNGFIKGCYWFEEISLFVSQGGQINKIIYGIVYEHYDFVFKDFIEYFDKIRSQGSEYKTFAKLMVNSLYGRFGMRDIEYYTFFERKENLEALHKKISIHSYITVNDYVLIEAEIDHKLKNIYKDVRIKHPHNNVSLAASITSKARIKLFKGIMDSRNEGGRLLYTDTDSIFMSFKSNIIGNKMGEVFWNPSDENTEILDAVFASPKMYALKYKNRETVKIKGVNATNMTFDEFKEMFYSKKIIKFTNVKFINTKGFSLKISKNLKYYDTNTYDKRVFSRDLKNTTALTHI